VTVQSVSTAQGADDGMLQRIAPIETDLLMVGGRFVRLEAGSVLIGPIRCSPGVQMIQALDTEPNVRPGLKL